MSKKKIVKKAGRPEPDAISPSVVRRLLSERKCYDSDHRRREEVMMEMGEEADSLKVKNFALEAKVRELEEKAREIEGNIPDPSHVERQISMSYRNGHKDGMIEREEELKREKVCHKPSHSFVDGKSLLQLSFIETIAIFFKMRESTVGPIKLSVLVPEGMKKPLIPDRDDVMKVMLDEFKSAAMKSLDSPPMITNQ